MGRSCSSRSATQVRSAGIRSRSFRVIDPLYARVGRFLIGQHGSVDEADFDRLYSEHAQALFGFLAYRTGNRALAEDLVADTFERALRARRRFDRRKAKEKTWLYAIALNRLRDLQRSAAAERRAIERVKEAAGPPVTPPADAELERRDTVERALAILSPEERDAIALRFGAELTVPEIAKVTQEPLTTVEGRVYRALRKLRGELEPPP
jgi:RNA polymerase sigma factor (sigma-70 family)